MELKSGYSNLPTYYRIFFHIMVWLVPLIGVGIFVILLVFVKPEEIMILIIPLVFGLVAPFVVGKDLVDTKTFKKQGSSIILSKRFGKPVAFDVKDLIDVTVFEEKNRIVVMLLSRDQKKAIPLGDWFSQEGKSELIEELEKESKDHDWVVSRFTNKMAVQDHVRTMYS